MYFNVDFAFSFMHFSVNFFIKVVDFYRNLWYAIHKPDKEGGLWIEKSCAIWSHGRKVYIESP